MNIKFNTILLTLLAGWINSHQQDVIEYLKAENKILKDSHGSKRIVLSDAQRIRLATMGKKVGRKALSEICNAFSPETILKWHRNLVARKYDGSRCRLYPGRPQISAELKNLIIKIARANRSWGSIRIRGQLKYLGYNVSHATISKLLKKHGLEPEPDKKQKITWREFIKAHWQSLAAIDFFTHEIYTLTGLIRYKVLVVIDYATRRVHIAGICPEPNGEWMAQMARNLTDPIDGFLKDKKYLIHDRDTLFTHQFLSILEAGGIKPVRTQAMAPNMSPFVERFIRSIKSECLDRMLIFGERHLRYVVNEYVDHYHHDRAHQGLGNEIISPLSQGEGKIICHKRLGGLLKTYRRAA